MAGIREKMRRIRENGKSDKSSRRRSPSIFATTLIYALYFISGVVMVLVLTRRIP